MYDKNSLENSYVELKSHYPAFYYDVFEMDAIIKANATVLDGLVTNIDLAVNNFFVMTADEPTVKRLEDFLWIKTNKLKPLIDRKKYILAVLSGYGKVSATKINEIIFSLTGLVNIVSFTNGDAYNNKFINIEINGSLTKEQLEDVLSILNNKIPAHLCLKIDYKVTESKLSFYIGAATEKYKFVQVNTV